MNREAAGAKKAGQSVGGQFPPTTRTEASGAGLQDAARPQPSPDRIRRLVADAEATQRHLMQVQEQMQRQAEELYNFQVAAWVKERYPNAARMVLQEDADANAIWSFQGLETADGLPVSVASPEDEDRLSEYAFDSPKPVPYSEREYPTHTIDLDAALSIDPACAHRRYIDTDGEFDDHAFSRLWSNASAEGYVMGTVRSRDDFADELRIHLASIANEQSDGELESYFDTEDIDAWVDDAIERYENNKPSDDEESEAFYDAIEAARPHDH